MIEPIEAEIKLGYREFSSAVDQVVRATSKLEAGVETSLNLIEERAKASFAEFGKSAKVASSEFQTFSQKVSKAAESVTLGDLETRFNSIAEKGRAAFGAVIDSGADFEQALLKSNTILKLNDEELKTVGESVRKLAGEIGVAIGPTETLAAQYQVLSSGFNNAADAEKVLRASLTLSAAGSVEAATATKALTGVLTSYGETAEKAGLRSDQFIKIADLGRAEIPELAQSLGLVTSVTAAAGITFEELGGAIATATENGQQTSAALEGIRGVVTSLITPTKGAEKEFARLGITVNETTLAQKGLAGTLAEIRTANGGAVDPLNRIIEGQVGLTTALALTRDGVDKFVGKTAEMNGALGTGAQNLAIINKGANESSKAFAAAFERLKVSASSAVLPIQTGLVKALTKLVEVADAVPAPVKTAALAFIGLGTAVFTAAGFIAGASLALPILNGHIIALGVRALPLATGAWALLTTQMTLAEGVIVGTEAATVGLYTVLSGGIVVIESVAAAVGTFTAAISAVSLGVGAVAIGLGILGQAYIDLENDVTKSNEAILKSEDLRKNGGKVKGNASLSNTEILGSSASTLAKKGVTTDDITQRIIDQEKQAELAREQQNEEQVRKATQRASKLRKIRSELAAELEKMQAEGAKAPVLPEVIDAKAEARAKKEAAKRQKAEDKAQKDSLGGALQNVKELLDATDEGNKEQAKNEAKALKAKQDAAKKAEAEAARSAQKLRDIKKSGLDQEVRDAEFQLQELDRLEQRGQDVSEARKAAIAKKAAAQAASVDVDAASTKAKSKDPDVIDAANRDAKGEKTQIAREAARDAAQVDEQAAQTKSQRAQEILSTDKEVAEKKLAILKDLAEAGAATEFEVRAAIQQKLDLQLKEIELQRELVRLQTDDPEKIAQAERTANAAIVEARAGARKEIEATTEALKKQKSESASATSLNLGGDGYGLDKFLADQKGFFDITKGKKGSKQTQVDQRNILNALNSSPTGSKLTGKGSAAELAGAASSAVEKVLLTGEFTLLAADGSKAGRLTRLSVNGQNSDLDSFARGAAGGA